MQNQSFNRFTVLMAQMVHFMDTRIPDYQDSSWCGAHADPANPWRSVPGDRKLMPGSGANPGNLPDCWLCVKAYEGRLRRGEVVAEKPKQASMF